MGYVLAAPKEAHWFLKGGKTTHWMHLALLLHQ